MPSSNSKFLFDKKDHDLLHIVNEVLNKDKSLQYNKRLFYNYFHPCGIKEMAESKGLRIAYAIVNILESIEMGKVDERLRALISLRDEVLNAADGPMPINTARVLLQIMKELVRSKDDYIKQLELAHDFRMTASGNPRILRKQLRHYHLLEMPEDWNQIAFDDHVHDINTKGRKSSTHLVMDAWIKGIRRLRIIYYNYIQSSVASELLQASEIMGITVRIGIEFSTKFRDKYVQIIWVARGFPDSEAFLCFLAEPTVVALMNQGKKVSEYQQNYVISILQKFNDKHRHNINKKYDINLLPIIQSEFLSFVGIGQVSLVHLSEFIYNRLISTIKSSMPKIKERYNKASIEERNEIENLIKMLNTIDVHTIIEEYLMPEKNPEIIDPNIPPNSPDCHENLPELLSYSPKMLVNRLVQFYSDYRFTLNLSNLYAEDVLEILYDCDGLITRLELFNLKDFNKGKTDHIEDINFLQRALNEGNIIQLKRVIKKIIERIDKSNCQDKEERSEKTRNILHDIANLRIMQKQKPIKSRIGSDSTGRSFHTYGMGFVILETLPKRAQKEIKRFPLLHKTIPVYIAAFLSKTYIPCISPSDLINFLYKIISYIPFLNFLSYESKKSWDVQEHSTQINSYGNIVTLGGILSNFDNGFILEDKEFQSSKRNSSLKYLTTWLKNTLKIIIGFIPAFITFSLTKDWWVLSYLGAFIWFGITGFRNIIQSVLGGGGIRRSPLLRWNDYVKWERLTDSLLFTGFSVPLLDFFVKTLMLQKYFNVTTSNYPIILYTVIALANGIYLISHNLYRGLPRTAVFWNFFRSVLSIPIAIELNNLLSFILSINGFININDILQKWAAIISKLASDCVAGIIEGTADRYYNIGHRLKEYESKLIQLFDVYTNLEILFPEADILEIIATPEKFREKGNIEAHDLETMVIINVLDMLYFWMYQPRSRTAFSLLLQKLSTEERHILLRSQFVLLRRRKIGHLLIDGIIGRNFSKALSFYLDRFPEYLTSIQRFNKGV